MKTCGNCAHWAENEDSKPFGFCGYVIHSNGDQYGYGHPSDDERAELERCKARVEDGSGYHACLITRMDFGCSEWEKDD